MTREQIDRVQRLVTDAAAPLPSIMELLGTADPDVHLGTVRELVRSVNERLAQVDDAVARLPANGGSGVTPGEAGVTDVAHLTALRDEWHGALDARCDATEAQEAAKGPEREALAAKENAALAHEKEAWEAFLQAPCLTTAEVLFKLRALQEMLKDSTYGGRTEDLFIATLRDLERLVGEDVAVVPATTTEPDNPDAALFEALAEYNRLETIAEPLWETLNATSRRDPGHNAAYEAASKAGDETTKAWERACAIPALTHAGLFAKLQGACRFTADLDFNNIEPEWDAIKADVLSLAGEARS